MGRWWFCCLVYQIRPKTTPVISDKKNKTGKSGSLMKFEPDWSWKQIKNKHFAVPWLHGSSFFHAWTVQGWCPPPEKSGGFLWSTNRLRWYTCDTCYTYGAFVGVLYDVSYDAPKFGFCWHRFPSASTQPCIQWTKGFSHHFTPTQTLLYTSLYCYTKPTLRSMQWFVMKKWWYR